MSEACESGSGTSLGTDKVMEKMPGVTLEQYLHGRHCPGLLVELLEPAYWTEPSLSTLGLFSLQVEGNSASTRLWPCIRGLVSKHRLGRPTLCNRLSPLRLLCYAS